MRRGGACIPIPVSPIRATKHALGVDPTLSQFIEALTGAMSALGQKQIFAAQ